MVAVGAYSGLKHWLGTLRKERIESIVQERQAAITEADAETGTKASRNANVYSHETDVESPFDFQYDVTMAAILDGSRIVTYL
jgi:alpha-L-fucosidase